MDILYYEGLDIRPVEKQFRKTERALADLDFRSADVKKIGGTPYYRAKLDDTNRLLFRFVRYENKTRLLFLEIILNHAYEKSRFLRGLPVDESKFISLNTGLDIPLEDQHPMVYCHPRENRLHLLDKFLSFDEAQAEIFRLPLPVIVIGSAGSGKTALTLEKLKTLSGSIVYVSLSAYLVENARKMYYSNHYDNPNQELDFFSFRDFIQGLRIPGGRELEYADFERWYTRHYSNPKIREPFRLFEELKGVITGSLVHAPFMNRDEYLGLGIRQSIFLKDQRDLVYHIFEKYLQFLKEAGLYDMNMVSYDYLNLVKPVYDYLVVDEVQDITNIQLKLLLSSLKTREHFLLSGDSNQIVHPNFFSWSKVKSLFFKDMGETRTIYRILTTNYRNSRKVTGLSNRLLRIKNARFGSVDRESTYLVDTRSQEEGEVHLLEDTEQIKKDLNTKTQNSTHFAILVMNNKDKSAAKTFFRSPLVFSIQEAKGLEYDNIILLNFVSDNPDPFAMISQQVIESDLEDDIRYMRAADKEDKDLEVYKFFINSLYVAFTRTVRNLYIIEKQPDHRLFTLLGIRKSGISPRLEAQKSNAEDWLAEARRLEQQGKFEQAREIRDRLLGIEHLTKEGLADLRKVALDPSRQEHEVKKERKQLFAYCQAHHSLPDIALLASLKFPRAMVYMSELNRTRKEFSKDCRLNRTANLTQVISKFGVDFRADEEEMTGLQLGLHYGNPDVFSYFQKREGSVRLHSSRGLNAFQIALRSCYRHELKKTQQTLSLKQLEKLYEKITLPYLRGSTGDKVIKLSSQSMSFFLVQYLNAIGPEIPDYSLNNGISMDQIMSLIELMPEAILPQYRARRQYVNSIMSSNEVDRDFIYNKKLFRRTGRGCYVLNPELKFLDDENSQPE